MKITSITATAAAFSLILVSAATYCIAQEEGESSGQSPTTPTVGKIAPWKAMEIAKQKVPGRALNANFEFDDGHWIYSVTVVHSHKISEVEIDPVSGKVGEVEAVTPAGEAKELEGDLHRAIAR
jgi:uncharacterized membrane protein YkoI